MKKNSIHIFSLFFILGSYFSVYANEGWIISGWGGDVGYMDELISKSDFIAEGIIHLDETSAKNSIKLLHQTLRGQIEFKNIYLSKLNNSNPKSFNFEREVNPNAISNFGFEPWSDWSALGSMDGTRVISFFKKEQNGLEMIKTLNCSGSEGETILKQVHELISLLSRSFDSSLWSQSIKKIGDAPILKSVLLRKVFALPNEQNLKKDLFEESIFSKCEDLQDMAFELGFSYLEKNSKNDSLLNTQILTNCISLLETTKDPEKFFDYFKRMGSEEFESILKTHPEWFPLIKPILEKNFPVMLQNQEFQQDFEHLKMELLKIVQKQVK